MTPEQLALVRDTAPVVEAAGDAFARRFYDRLLALHPDASHLVPDDLRADFGAVVREVVFLASAAGNLPLFLVRARELGARWQTYGAHACDYPVAREALLSALAAAVGERWTPEVALAWHRLYDLAADAMLEGAAGGLFSASP